jgi:hypothetical protein
MKLKEVNAVTEQGLTGNAIYIFPHRMHVWDYGYPDHSQGVEYDFDYVRIASGVPELHAHTMHWRLKEGA